MPLPRKSKTIRKVIRQNATKKLDDLSTEGRVLFDLMVLITDIKYRVQYGETIEINRGRGYNKNIESEVLTDQITPVDDGLSGFESTGVIC